MALGWPIGGNPPIYNFALAISVTRFSDSLDFSEAICYYSTKWKHSQKQSR